MRLERILYPTDFSPASKQALEHALFFTEQFGAELHMFHAVVLHADDPVDPQRDFPGAGELYEALSEVSASHLAGWIPSDRRRELRIKEVRQRGFSAGEMILDYAAENDVDLIVMGTHGRGAAARAFLGSVAERVLRHARCPVLTLRYADEPRDLEAFERILVPIDFSEGPTQTAVAYAKDLAQLYGASVQLLHVVQPSSYPSFYSVPPELRFEVLQPKCLEAMDRLMASAPGPVVPHENHVVTGRPWEQIVGFAEASGSDMLVIPSHGMSGIERALLGSTVDRVVRRAHCPVLTVKPFGKSLLDP
jgi:nucleotide-binding universal stress UspA family protein